VNAQEAKNAASRPARGRLVIVGGGVVQAADYEAETFGARTPMAGPVAPRL
jgi:hypothetical protein